MGVNGWPYAGRTDTASHFAEILFKERLLRK
jgi:hypothetical protein